MPDKNVPKLKMKIQSNHEVTTMVRISQIENGFMLRGGQRPVHYETLEELAGAVKASVLAADWTATAE